MGEETPTSAAATADIFHDGTEVDGQKRRRRRSTPSLRSSIGEDDAVPTTVETMTENLPPEPQEGKCEYKLKLINPTPHRFQRLITQLKWRLAEGEGEAVYEIGVSDDGTLTGLSAEELQASLNTLSKMAEAVGAHITVLRKGVTETGQVAEVHLRRLAADQQFLDVRIALLGAVDSGKSTLLGVLLRGELDNGRGKTRLNLFRHGHEIRSGRTSSISHEILGFDSDGVVTNYDAHGSQAAKEQICERSSKIVTFLDLAGSDRYFSTTIFGLTAHSPHYAALVVSAVTGVTRTTLDHLALAVTLHLPIFVVITKTDVATQEQLTATMRHVAKTLKSPANGKRVPMFVTSPDDVLLASTSLHSRNIAPVLLVSSVTGMHLDLLRQFLNLLPPHARRESAATGPVDFQIDETFDVRDVGPVVGGTMHQGTVHVGDTLLLGPDTEGAFRPVRVGSIHRHGKAYLSASAGQTATFALDDCERKDIRTGQALLGLDRGAPPPSACMSFDAEVYVMSPSASITPGYQAVVYVGSVRQSARIEPLGGRPLKGGETGLVRFELQRQPELIRSGAHLLFTDGSCKGIGHVTTVHILQPPPASVAAAAAATASADDSLVGTPDSAGSASGDEDAAGTASSVEGGARVSPQSATDEESASDAAGSGTEGAAAQRDEL